MQRLLIAETGNLLGDAIATLLEHRFCTEICQSGRQLLEHIRNFEPDVLLLDLSMQDIDGLQMLHTIRNCCVTMKIVVITNFASEQALQMLEQLGVSQVLRKPCSIDNLCFCVQSLSFDQQDQWCVDLKIDQLFFSLGFRPGGLGYPRTHEALRMKYLDREATVTKHIYPALVKKFGGNVKQAEKLIHNTVKTAMSRGKHQTWMMYFPYLDEKHSCPSNDEFLSRMECALRSGEYFHRCNTLKLGKAE